MISFEATSGFTLVAACGFAHWNLTTPDHSGAAPMNYRGSRTTPQAGLKPARCAVVAAYGQVLLCNILQSKT